VEYKLDGIVLRCRNVAELSKFYDNVMRLKRFLPPPTEPVGRIARYEVTGGTVFELLGNGPELDAPDDRTQVPITPMFRVDDLGRAVEELTAAGVRWVSERQAIPGAPAELATFADPEGHHICVFEMTAEDTSRPAAN
jgi:predicted enzyme related to lactoylglutathione lyase